jgi:hypothetical protein
VATLMRRMGIEALYRILLQRSPGWPAWARLLAWGRALDRGRARHAIQGQC